MRPMTAEDVKNDMLSINSKKALGPDGYCASSFKSNWAIVGPEIT